MWAAIASLAWSAYAMAGGHGDDLSAVIVGAKVLEMQPEALYAHDPVHFHVTGDATFERAARELGFTREATPFVYPPLIAALAQPLTSWSFPRVAEVWLACSTLAYLLGMMSLTRLVPVRRWWILPLGLLLASRFDPLLYSLWLGQTTPVIFLLIACTLAFEVERPAFAGACLALAVFVKLLPVLLVMVWVFERRWRACLGAVVTLLGLVLGSVVSCGVDLHLSYAARLREIGAHTLVAFNNQSLVGALSRFGGDFAPFDWSLFTPPFWGVLLVLGLTAISGVALFSSVRQGHGAQSRALVLLVLLLVPSIAWTHYFVLTIPIALLLARDLTGRSRLVPFLPLLLLIWPLGLEQWGVGPRRLGISLPCAVALLQWLMLVGLRFSVRARARLLRGELR